MTTTQDYPTEIEMPTGSGPESIVLGEGATAYVSAMGTGDIYTVNLKTGTYEHFLDPIGPTAVGMALDTRNRLYICGGLTGKLWVVDTSTRELLATYELGNSDQQTFINELIITPTDAYVTDSFAPVLYRLPYGPNGDLPTDDDVVRLDLTGDIAYQMGDTFADCFNANGIATTPDGTAIVIVQTNTGKLFRVDPETGTATEVDLGSDTVIWGDGLVREGTTLHVVQNLENCVSVLEISPDGSSAKVVDKWTDERFDTPTAMARFGNRFYLSNARFTTPDHETLDFRLISIDR
jgi:sugar lactone lactonase YvrE